MYNLLDKYKDINDIKNMGFKEKIQLAEEIRRFLIDKVSKTGGHLSSNLGVVELTMCLFDVFDFNKDKIVWDVGHQSYVYKILTGRKGGFDTLRQFGGMSGFPKTSESKYDFFQTGHSSTSVSAALGMARSRDIQNKNYNVIAVIGDGALTGGMALEALNDVGYRKTRLIIVLNDNQMSIAHNVGGVSRYLNKLRLDPKYNKLKQDVENALKKIPNIGPGMAKYLEKFKNGIKQMIVPGMFFEDIGLKYLGPIDGHNIKDLVEVFTMARKINGPVVIHVVTKKGKGYKFAEKNPGKFHGIGPFDCSNGEIAVSSTETYSKAFGNKLMEIAKKNCKLVAVTAAMRDGTGLKSFSNKFPDRFFDVGIAEQHAVTLCAGMARTGLKPVFAVYSTFLQRAYDQIIHDVCIQKLSVIFAVDRAGIVGADGETHQGIFDLSYLTQMPNMKVMCPKCTDEIGYMLDFALEQEGPVAIRYPRGGDNVCLKPIKEFKLGKWERIEGHGKIALIAEGKMIQYAILARRKLIKIGIDVIVINACFVKPIDEEMINTLVENNIDIVTIEDNIVRGGMGSYILEYINSLQNHIKVINLGFKDEFIPHGKPEILYKLYGLDAEGIKTSVLKIVSEGVNYGAK
ncbi:MAG: 1-deoxy-D-xylulose-5-phosphate synthase [Clostridium tyrobutyricum]|jgi:1-deoxy-D-xylulose-5-phosphate synthase|uniref:1-deoxy-D-xylulose-5-phosphate synthase n=1 Tax=Clostridium tyrobutyricum TaxID=1519 RepID=UPI0002FF0620|nr:1-deoxy-D-xylulose-5-phosphate synthase [Clostridium tyrobutyricum]MBR9646927.1 1-deoxy-D-xylulose-5-phosphate synthase [Clostridium tyrobutyricum]MBV4415204.1 1-deoxy-D-xylulose-5-phosphate synthase [Clostridium tyrobutyricum]MBV4420875.1 1-deoxy-D-xylulose-5-phosphate synthase [Clostridium tyrobutyricum]MBV4423984.1 1-deoxy-D-xylulose-5-phosphate synthase [Clostridium tyrobutyricum]MBV4429821.1 1-deoxy-D-xylulose-5-phosphate synthase [Clostridium tyrobutyricum]